MNWYGWKPYVPAAERRARAARKIRSLQKKGLTIRPVEIKGRAIAHTFWGQAWCAHLEKFSDFENRLPRGRTYVRNGSVCHLEIAVGAIRAMVSGSRLYDVNVSIKKLTNRKWNTLKKRCTGQIGSVLELLQGQLSKSVMEVVTDRDEGLFPLPKEIGLSCTCPDWALMCKHVAAVLYGVGARLDEEPQLLFLLRGVDQQELIAAGTGAAGVMSSGKQSGRRRIAEASLEEVFGIDLAQGAAADDRSEGSKRPPGTRGAARSATPRSAQRSGTPARGARRPPREETKTARKAARATKVSKKSKGTSASSAATRPGRPPGAKKTATARRRPKR